MVDKFIDIGFIWNILILLKLKIFTESIID